MRPVQIVCFLLIGATLMACTSGAPRAPIGFNKQPANSSGADPSTKAQPQETR